MTEVKSIYSSSNGDRWLLVRDPASGQPLVRHEPNRSSGGVAVEIDVDDFMRRDGQSPQGEALRKILAIGSFQDARSQSDSSSVAPPKIGTETITAGQIRAGRGLLGWSLGRLAHEAELQDGDLERCERGDDTPHEHLVRLARALEQGGVILVGEGELTKGGPGVRMGRLT